MTVVAKTNLIATFDNNSLTSVEGVSILGTNPYRTPQRKLSSYLVARRDAQRTNSAFYTQRNIAIRCCIDMPTRAVVERQFDVLMTLLQGVNKELIVSQSTGVRKYYCTLASINYLIEGGAFLEFELVFTCDDMFGYDTSYTNILGPKTVTTATSADQYQFGGSAPWQMPEFILLYSAISGGTSKYVTLSNSATGQTITITRTWTSGDRLTINALTGVVQVNGTDVEFTGAIPTFAPGLGNITYADNFTTRTLLYNARYYRRYI